MNVSTIRTLSKKEIIFKSTNINRNVVLVIINYALFNFYASPFVLHKKCIRMKKYDCTVLALTTFKKKMKTKN